jgi:hypothetical protein
VVLGGSLPLEEALPPRRDRPANPGPAAYAKYCSRSAVGQPPKGEMCFAKGLPLHQTKDFA